MRLDLFFANKLLTMIIFDRNEGYCRENMLQYKIMTWSCGYQIIVLFIAFEALYISVNQIESWILLVSSNI